MRRIPSHAIEDAPGRLSIFTAHFLNRAQTAIDPPADQQAA